MCDAMRCLEDDVSLRDDESRLETSLWHWQGRDREDCGLGITGGCNCHKCTNTDSNP
jgi:hypothetical protein